jgi:sugar/nucleoside kinase (ribokinase family)
MNILAMSVCCVDVFPDTGRCYVGGNSLNFAVQAKKSGAEKAAVLGAIGNDEYGQLIRSYLYENAIDTAYLHTLPTRTASNRIYIDAQGDRYFLPDSWDGGAYAEYRVTPRDLDYLNTFDLVAITCHDPNFPAVLENKKNYHLVVDYLDSRDFAFMERALTKTDITFISGNDEVVEVLKPLSQRYHALIVVTLGARGSAVLLNGQSWYQPAEPVSNVVDTTGCGDAYQATFSLSWFKDGSIEKAMKAGSVAAAYVLGHVGGVD